MAEPFFWGAGGKRVSSPEAAARQRAIAEALIGRSETPAQNWAQGLADVAAAWSGTQLRNQADEAEQEGQRAVAELLAGLTPESGFSDISAVMANPWSTASQSAVAQALMGNQFNRANIADERAYQAGLLADQRAYDQPMRDLELEGAGLSNQTAQAQLDALLNPSPPAPIKLGGGDVLLDPVTFEPLFDARGDDLTSAIQNYQFLISQGVDPTTAQDQAFGGGRTVVNVGDQGQRMGTVPPGYAVIDDPNNPSGFRLEPIPGGPVATDAAAAAAQQDVQTVTNAQGAETLLDATTSIRDLIQNSGQPVTGTFSRPFAALSNTPAGKLRSYVSSLQSGVALGAMQRLKEASATGSTGFGALSEKELDILINEIGNLKPDETEPEIFLKTIDRIEERARRVVSDIVRDVPPEKIQELGLQGLIEQFGGGQSQANPSIFGGAADDPLGLR